MELKFSLNDIYDKNINFLIGSGASYGLFPTLELHVKNEQLQKQTIETLATSLYKTKDSDPLYTLLFMHYYKTCIEPVMTMDFELAELIGCSTTAGDEVLRNYKELLEKILNILQHRKRFDRRCNLFTTNYDGCIAHSADKLLENGNIDFIVNDGTRGFKSKYLQAKNFNSYVCQTGVFERHHSDIPQINLIHLHGSAYWYNSGEYILVDYSKERNEQRNIGNQLFQNLESFSAVLLDSTKQIINLPRTEIDAEAKKKFWESYETLPIVNPTKWKFHETVFEEHYYQMLRLLSYELEKPNSVFITFGFSFADEHILNLVKCSLSNPTLQLFISCFNNTEEENMRKHFGKFKNVQYLTSENNLDFKTFNEQILTHSKPENIPVMSEVTDAS